MYWGSTVGISFSWRCLYKDLNVCWIVQDLVNGEEEVGQRYKIEKGIRGCLQRGEGLVVELMWELFTAVW